MIDSNNQSRVWLPYFISHFRIRFFPTFMPFPRKFVTIDGIDEKQASSLSQTYITTPVAPVGKSVPNVCGCTCGCRCECGVVVVVVVGLGMGVCKKAGNFNLWHYVRKMGVDLTVTSSSRERMPSKMKKTPGNRHSSKTPDQIMALKPGKSKKKR